MAENTAMLVAAGTPVKVVVWDLDGTIWDGTLSEDRDVRLRDAVADVIKRLDARGILHSLCSRNDAEPAMQALVGFGLAEYFLCPQIGWSAKSAGIKAIAAALNIGLDAVLFVDDQPFERAEVGEALPQVRTVDAREAARLADDPHLMPAAVTEEARRRRQAYRDDEARSAFEREFTEPSDVFLRNLELKLTIAPAAPGDLHRAEELTLRTNQLNSTGVTFSYAQLERFREMPDHILVMADLRDRFGDYGKIALALVEKRADAWRLKLLLVSCRVLSRGVGGIMLNYLALAARRAGKPLDAEFRNTGRNRPMQIAYRFADFREIAKEGDISIFRHDQSKPLVLASYVEVIDDLHSGQARNIGELAPAILEGRPAVE